MVNTEEGGARLHDGVPVTHAIFICLYCMAVAFLVFAPVINTACNHDSLLFTIASEISLSHLGLFG